MAKKTFSTGPPQRGGFPSTGPWFVGKVAPAGFWPEEEENQPELSDVRAYDTVLLKNNALAPVVVAMAVIGVIPVTIKSPWLSLRTTFPFCVVIFTVFMASACVLLADRVPEVIGKDTQLDVRVVAAELVAHVLPLMCVPIIWAQSRNIGLDTKQYVKIKDMILSVTAMSRMYRHRDLRRRVFYSIATVVLCVQCVLFVLGACHFIEELKVTVLHIPCLVYSVLIESLVWWNVVLQSVQLMTLVNTVNLGFSKMSVRGAVTANSVRTYRRLWVEIRQLFGYDDSITHTVYILNLMYMLSQCTLTSFEALSFYVAGNSWGCVGHGVFCLLYLTEIIILCDCAHRAVAAMKDPFISTLDRLAAGQLDEETYEEVCSFYTAIIGKSPVYSIRGYASMDRPTMASLIATILSYLIFLAQYQADNETIQDK